MDLSRVQAGNWPPLISLETEYLAHIAVSDLGYGEGDARVGEVFSADGIAYNHKRALHASLPIVAETDSRAHPLLSQNIIPDSKKSQLLTGIFGFRC